MVVALPVPEEFASFGTKEVKRGIKEMEAPPF
jgi:hypothetical protein